MHEHTGNAVEPLRVAHQHPIVEESGIAPVVGHQSGEREPEALVVVTVVVDMAGMGGDVGVLPLAPPHGRSLVHRRIGILQDAGVGGGQVSRSAGGTPSWNRAHSSGTRTHRPRHRLHLGRRRGHDTHEDHLGDAVRIRLAIGETERRSP